MWRSGGIRIASGSSNGLAVVKQDRRLRYIDHPFDAGDARLRLDLFLQAKGSGDAGEPYAVTLDDLGGVEAWVAEETPGVCMYNVAFVCEGYACYGMLMWVPQDDAEAGPFMMEAMRTLSAPEK